MLESVPAKVIVLLAVRVLPLAIAAVPAESNTFPEPFDATLVIVLTPETFVASQKPVADDPGNTISYDVTAAGASETICVVPAWPFTSALAAIAPRLPRPPRRLP